MAIVSKTIKMNKVNFQITLFLYCLNSKKIELVARIYKHIKSF